MLTCRRALELVERDQRRNVTGDARGQSTRTTGRAPHRRVSEFGYPADFTTDADISAESVNRHREAMHFAEDGSRSVCHCKVAVIFLVGS